MCRRYLYNDNPEWLDWTGIICGFSLFTALIAGAIAAESAPLGTYTQSNYCVSLERAK
jgi:hypothetical protein